MASPASNGRALSFSRAKNPLILRQASSPPENPLQFARIKPTSSKH